MSDNIFDNFIDKLVAETLSEKIQWDYLQIVQDKLSEGNVALPPLIIMQNEFSRIDFHRSYFCTINVGTLLLIFSSCSPGNEEIPYHEDFSLNLLRVPYSNDFDLLAEDSESLYRLENAIREKITKNVRFTPNDASAMMNRYIYESLL